MMTSDNYNIGDFTVQHYAELLDLAKENYNFIRYGEIDLSERFVLWRHDCDFSLNRSLRLAEIENQKGVISTFFLNPHSEFYNWQEKGQSKIIRKILDLGHDIALHFDANYYDVKSEEQLNKLVSQEASWLKDTFSCDVNVFSFHNPTELLLTYEEQEYGGLLNCYSKTFKQNIPYCSDSNGYWRFRRLRDVLSDAKDPCLQVLTHPGWWQDDAMLPRERILRCASGRAHWLMKDYDSVLERHERNNIGLGEGE